MVQVKLDRAAGFPGNPASGVGDHQRRDPIEFLLILLRIFFHPSLGKLDQGHRQAGQVLTWLDRLVIGIGERVITGETGREGTANKPASRYPVPSHQEIIEDHLTTNPEHHGLANKVILHMFSLHVGDQHVNRGQGVGLDPN